MADEAEASRAKKAAAAAGVQTEEKSTDENGSVGCAHYILHATTLRLRWGLAFSLRRPLEFG